MENEGLLFIPDISGYTKFINKTEIEHSRFIIQELLEVLVNSNKIGLNISEIEGDAILFYRFGKPPSIPELYEQVEAMFCNFHKQLNRYEQRRICPCMACQGAKELSLKVIAHHGEFSTYNVKEFSKLIGKDVINVHQLLKNDIPNHEYWLVTDNLYTNDHKKETLPGWLEWQEGIKKADADEIKFRYSMLTPLKDNLPLEDENEFAIKGNRELMITVQKDFDYDIDTLFSIVVDLTRRAQWLDGIKSVEKISTPLPQVGTSHHCVLDKKINVIITSDFKKDKDSIILEETDRKRMGTCQIKLDKKGDYNTLMTFNFFLKKNIILLTVFNLFMKNKIKSSLQKSLENLEGYLAVIKASAQATV